MTFIQSVSCGQKCNCDSTFIIVKHHVENNYAGWFDKTKTFNQKDFQKLTTEIIVKCKSISSDSICYTAIKKYIDYFKDRHLQIKYSGKSISNNSENSEPTIIEKG